jgi:peptide/nickel transport system permease protein
LYQQYWDWLTQAIRGNFGYSLFTHQSVIAAIGQRLPCTLSLVIGSLLVSVVFGVALGVFSAARGGRAARAADATAMVGWVIPVYWIAGELIVIFAVKLACLPATGYVPLSQSVGEWLRSLVLPVAALSIGAIAGFAKFTRDSMLDALSSEYVRMGRANGVPQWSIVFRHAFKGASVQVMTLSGLLVVGLLTGTVFAEQVFGLPGLGTLITQGTLAQDLPVVQGVAVFFTLIVIAVNLVVDLAYSLVSPKVRLG